MSDVGLCIRQPIAIDLDAIAHPQSGSSMAISEAEMLSALGVSKGPATLGTKRNL